MGSNSHQPFLNSSTNSTSSSKILVFFLSLFAIAFSCVFLAPHLIKVGYHSDPSFLEHLCDQAHDPQACLLMISKAVTDNGVVQESNGINLLKIFLEKSLSQISMTMEAAAAGMNFQGKDQKDQAALADCLELMDLSIDRVNYILSSAANWSTHSVDAQTWLSGVLTNHVTCFDEIAHKAQPSMKLMLQDLISKTRISLAVLASLSASEKDDNLRPLNGGFPSWILARDRKLIESSSSNIQANVVVAQDGSGNYRTIQEAVASAPDKSKSRYVIYVKRGTYKENVDVGKKKKNVMIVGDGMDLTIVTGSLNVVDGSTTFKSATLAVAGDGFILQDVWVQNTAGPEKHQAVALRVSADQSVINRCLIDAFQDTLYAHNYRQFYRDCSITGTIDFIFGNAAVVLQKCQIIARKPMAKQKNMVTAQGRIDPNQNTGTSIQDCNIIASPDLELVQNSFPTYLGRPWKEYSRTVVMQSHIGGHIDPAGWAEWNGDFALRTLYYGEYANRGPGAGTSRRVKWPGYHVITDPNEARKFTVAELIQGKHG
ncbi:hypothetical protein GH714_024291 [Hevea brasiliensis]|uniref:Pectinesterase n=1 Tax=Hevea brasiliensis TaxID=3981 RepID=A0A6A6MQP4_HEVBR|nr:hypothetical protein GH714_024291 [Hevea brasiliensis]